MVITIYANSCVSDEEVASDSSAVMTLGTLLDLEEECQEVPGGWLTARLHSRQLRQLRSNILLHEWLLVAAPVEVRLQRGDSTFIGTYSRCLLHTGGKKRRGGALVAEVFSDTGDLVAELVTTEGSR